MGEKKKKILLLLYGGLALAFAGTPGRSLKTLLKISQEWGWIEDQELKRKIKELYKSRLVDFKENPDRSISITVSKNGKKEILKYKIDEIKISHNPQEWDGKWRLVIFDIPEPKKPARDALREKLRDLDFFVLQKSVFVYPFDCRKEVEFLTEFFEVKPHVRYGILDTIDNELHLLDYFRLSKK